MDQSLIDLRSIITAVSLLTFIGIVVWSYSGRRRDDFAQAANLPFADEGMDLNTQDREKKHV